MNTIILLDRNSIKEENSEAEVKRKLSSKEWKLPLHLLLSEHTLTKTK